MSKSEAGKTAKLLDAEAKCMRHTTGQREFGRVLSYRCIQCDVQAPKCHSHELGYR